MTESTIVWSGDSLFAPGTSVVVLLTGLGAGSTNRKTGRVVQAHVLVDGAVPAEAARSGRDRAVCGDCPRRRSEERGSLCYVSLARGYPQVGEKLRRGLYPRVSSWSSAAELVRGRFVRLGAYGDPAAVPYLFWERLLRVVDGWTAYTHQWRRFPELSAIAMASVESEAERAEAERLGWRTYRVRPFDELEPARGEAQCPAAIEAGKRTTCVDCRLCSGLASRGRSVSILDHSVKALWDRDLGPRRRRLPVVAGVG